MQKIRYLNIFAITLIGIFNLYQIFKRLNLGIGMSDESFPLQISNFGVKNPNWTFTPIISFIYHLVDQDIYFARILNVLYCTLAIACLAIAIIGKKKLSRIKVVYFLTLLPVFYLPLNTFSFLLITPSYQSVNYSSFLIFIALTISIYSKSKKISIHFFGIGFFAAMISSCRPSNIITLLPIVAFMVLKNSYRIRNAIIVWAGFAICNLLLFKNYFNMVTAYFETYHYISSINYQHFSLLDNFSKTLTYIFLISISYFLIHLRFMEIEYINKIPKFIYLLLSFGIIYSQISVNFPLRVLVSSLTIVFFLIIHLHAEFKKNISLYFIALTPLLINFGSSISIGYLWQYLTISQSLILLLLVVEFDDPKLTKLIKSTNFTLLILISICTFAAISFVNRNYDYEKVNSRQMVKVENFQDLAYSREKAKALVQYFNSIKNTNIDNRYVLDLSFFHPGLLNGTTARYFPFFLADESLDSSTVRQLKFIHNYADKHRFNLEYALVGLNDNFSSTYPHKCLKADSILGNENLKKNINIFNQFVNVSIQGVYVRQTEDTSMIHSYYALVKSCK